MAQLQIDNTTAFITGAGSGIGRAVAIALSERGARQIMLCDIDTAGLNETALEVTKAGANPCVRHLDVTDHNALEQAMLEADSIGGLDIVCNNAGIVAGLPDYPDTSPHRISLLVAINLTAVIVGTAVAVQIMRRHGSGSIVNTASTGVLRAKLNDAPYRASKAGVVMLSQCCKDLASEGIRVNAILPGITETAILDKMGDENGRPDWLEPLTRNIHIWTPAEIAANVIGLIEDDSKAGDTVIMVNEPIC